MSTEIERVDQDDDDAVSDLVPRGQGKARVPRLSPKQMQAAALLAVGHAPSAVADQLGVSHKTIPGWRKKPDFAAEVDRLVADGQRRIMRQIHSFAPAALRTLITIATDEKARPADRIKAATELLSLGGLDPMAAYEDPEAARLVRGTPAATTQVYVNHADMRVAPVPTEDILREVLKVEIEAAKRNGVLDQVLADGLAALGSTPDEDDGGGFPDGLDDEDRHPDDLVDDEDDPDVIDGELVEETGDAMEKIAAKRLGPGWRNVV